MNTIQFSFMFKFLSYLYSNAYELEYSLVHVLIMIYELAYSLRVMFLICSSLFFIVHQVSMNRGRIRDEMTVRWAVVAAPNLACHFEGVGSMGVLGILNIITKSRLSFLILITAPKMPNLSLMPLKPSCHPQPHMRDAVLKYAIALLNE